MSKLLWYILCINLWGFAIFGTIFTIIGVIGWSSGATLGKRMLGQPVLTAEQNYAWLILSLAFAFLGAIWIYLQLSGKGSYREIKQDKLNA